MKMIKKSKSDDEEEDGKKKYALTNLILHFTKQLLNNLCILPWC